MWAEKKLQGRRWRDGNLIPKKNKSYGRELGSPRGTQIQRFAQPHYSPYFSFSSKYNQIKAVEASLCLVEWLGWLFLSALLITRTPVGPPQNAGGQIRGIKPKLDAHFRLPAESKPTGQLVSSSSHWVTRLRGRQFLLKRSTPRPQRVFSYHFRLFSPKQRKMVEVSRILGTYYYFPLNK